MDQESKRVRGRQLLLFSGIAAALLITFAVWFSAGGGEAPPPRGGIRAELAGSRSAEAVWLRRSEARIGQLENASPGDGNQEPALRGGERSAQAAPDA